MGYQCEHYLPKLSLQLVYLQGSDLFPAKFNLVPPNQILNKKTATQRTLTAQSTNRNSTPCDRKLRKSMLRVVLILILNLLRECCEFC